MKYLLILFLLSACGPKVTIDPQLLPYFERFQQKVGVSYAGVTGEITDLSSVDSGDAVGLCTVGGNTKTIQIDSTFWSTAVDSAKEQTIAHELGHCAMNLGHIPTRDENEGACPTSIMYPFAFGQTMCYTGNEDYYYNELKTPGLPQMNVEKKVIVK